MTNLEKSQKCPFVYNGKSLRKPKNMVIFKWLYLSYCWTNMNYVGFSRKVSIWALRIPKTDFNYLIASWSYESLCGGTLHILYLPFTSHVKALKCDNLDTVDRTVFGPASLGLRNSACTWILTTNKLHHKTKIYPFVNSWLPVPQQQCPCQFCGTSTVSMQILLPTILIHNYYIAIIQNY